MTFTLGEPELSKIKTWDDDHYPKCKYFDDGSKPESPQGAIGGRLTYCFTLTGLGVITVVKCSCGEKINVTDYDSW